MQDDTKAALKLLCSSKKLSLDREKFDVLMHEFRSNSSENLWDAVHGAKPKKPTDPLADAVKRALAKYRAPAATKAARLVGHLLPDRDAPPKTMAASLKLLRQYFADDEIARGANELMERLRSEGGMTVTLDAPDS